MSYGGVSVGVGAESRPGGEEGAPELTVGTLHTLELLGCSR